MLSNLRLLVAELSATERQLLSLSDASWLIAGAGAFISSHCMRWASHACHPSSHTLWGRVDNIAAQQKCKGLKEGLGEGLDTTQATLMNSLMAGWPATAESSRTP